MAVVGTTTLVVTDVGGGTGALKCSLSWVANASGAVSGNALTIPAGTILGVEFIPSTVNVPTNLYDVDFLDQNGTSMFDDGTGTSIGANLSSTLSANKVPFVNGASTTYVRAWLQGASGGNPYQLTVANAGAGGAGQVNIYVVPVAV